MSKKVEHLVRWAKNAEGLTKLEAKFVEEYLLDANGTQAAIRAGYKARSAAVAGSRLLRRDTVVAALNKRMAKRSSKLELTADNVLREIGRIALFDPRNMYTENGTIKAPSEWDDDTAAVIASVENFEEYEGRGEDRELIGFTKKVKLWDKGKALDMAAKHLGLFERDNAQRAPNIEMTIATTGPTLVAKVTRE